MPDPILIIKCRDNEILELYLPEFTKWRFIELEHITFPFISSR